MNILYIDDYINLYNHKIKKIIIDKPYKKTLENGLIINSKKFIRKYNKILKSNNLTNSFFKENIIVIINDLYHKEDKELLIKILEELNYKKVIFIKESRILYFNKEDIYLNCNESYFYIIYKKKIYYYQNNEINKELLKYILKKFKYKDLIVYGKNANCFLKNLKKSKIKYYKYEKNDNVPINLLLNNYPF